MAWTPSLDIAEFSASAYILGKGAAGSEVDVGETDTPTGRIFFSVVEIKGGASLGSETTVDVVTTGVGAYAAFGLRQHLANLTRDIFTMVFPGSTLSAGPTNKTLTLDADTICGVAAIAGSLTGRWVFHSKAVTDLADTSQDIVFPRAIVIPTDDEIPLDGTGPHVVRCMLIAMPDANNDIVVIGKNAA